MARQDINMDAVYGELNLTDNISGKRFYEFTLLDEVPGMDNNSFCYGEIAIPVGFEAKYSDSTGIHVRIPYTPEYKMLSVSLRCDLLGGGSEYIVNRADNKIWFPVYREDSQGAKISIRLSEFRAISERETCNLILRDGYFALFSGDETDMQINASLPQNEAFLLKASAGNLYQFPLTGVGLIDYLHGNFENSGLAQKLQQEFFNDNMVVVNAYMDSSTGELLLQVVERGDEEPGQTLSDELL